MKIRKLDSKVIQQIAAGEVVERPASVVKELVENSLDAGAGYIKVNVKDGGKTSIEIVDDGGGIAQSDLALSLELHATSKLVTLDDLNSIGSFGFRGEALASIKAVADIKINSATKDGAWEIDSETNEISPTSRSQGTTIQIKNLFRKIPGRRKFLKSDRVEEQKIRGIIKAFAVINPQVSFEYIVDEKQVFNLSSDTVVQRISELYKINEKDLIETPTSTADKDSKNIDLSISGTLGHPSIAGKRPVQLIWINGRLIKSGLINAAVKQAYSNKIPQTLSPQSFIVISIAGTEIDINVHPRKEEVKFSDEGRIFHEVKKAVESTLAKHMQSQFSERFQNEKVYSLAEEEEAYGNNRQFKAANSNNENTAKFSYPKSARINTQEALNFSKNILSPLPKPRPSATTQNDIASNNTQFDGNTSNYMQAYLTYIVIAQNDKLLLIDQHAADERINYEKFMSKLSSSNNDKSLLMFEEIVEVEAEIPVKKVLESLSEFGFEIEDFGSTAKKLLLKITHVPSFLMQNTDFKTLVLEFIQTLEEGNGKSNLDEIRDKLAATLACHGSIRAGRKLSQSEMAKIVDDLWKCKEPYTCPHGRPIVIELDKDKLEKLFYRKM